MSTRSTTHFVSGSYPIHEAIIYRHSDGYPGGAGTDIYRFLADVEAQTSDTRFGDPSYLAAKYVVWLAAQSAQYGNGNMLDFLGVGVVSEDPGDIEYRYVVACNGGEPVVTCYPLETIYSADFTNYVVELGEPVEIPRPEAA